MSTHGISSGSVTADGRRNGDEMTQGTVAEAALEQTDDGAPQAAAAPPGDLLAGGSWELLTLALPLIVSQSFMTVQVFVDTILLAWHNQREMAASFPAIMWYWLPFGFLLVTAGYVSTFVAQYTGAGRPQRVGPAVWQGIHFATIAGLLFLLMVPVAPQLIAMGGHSGRFKCSRRPICAAFASRHCR